MKAIYPVVFAACLFLTSCYVQTDLTLSSDDDLSLSSMLVSIDVGGGPEIIEASARHSLNLLGLRDAFTIEQYKPKSFTMEDYLLLKPTRKLSINKSIHTGDKISVTQLGGGMKKFVWEFEPRTQAFAEKVTKDPELLNKVFLVVRIAFPGSVDTANTSENAGNVYTWRITNAQMSKPFKIQAIYGAR